MFCANCGNEVSNTARFCFSCGAPIASEPQVELVAEPVTEPVAEEVAVETVETEEVGALYSFSDDLTELADLTGVGVTSTAARLSVPMSMVAEQFCREFRTAYRSGTLTRVGDDLSFASEMAIVQLIQNSGEESTYPYTLRVLPLPNATAPVKELTNEILDGIRSLLEANSRPGEWVPLSSAAQLMKANGYHWEQFGCTKVKAFLPKLPFLESRIDGLVYYVRVREEDRVSKALYPFSGVLSELIDPHGAPLLALARELEETPEKAFETLADTFAIAYVHGMIREDGTALSFDTESAKITLKANKSTESVYPYNMQFAPIVSESEDDELTIAVEKEIYGMLIRKFPLNEWLPMASVNLELHRCGYTKERFGFAKMKAMLETLSRFLVVDTTQTTNGVPNDRVMLHRVSDWEQEAPRDTQKKAAIKLPATLDGVALSAKTLSKINLQMTGTETMPPASVTEALYAAYEAAEKPDTLFNVDETFLFKTELKSVRGKQISVSIKVSDREDTDWYLNWGGVSDGGNASKPGDALTQFAYLGMWNDFLKSLAGKALEETWSFKGASADDYTILRQYIKFTFYHLQLEDKICISEDGTLAAFNTGLVDRHYEDIFACFTLNTTPGHQKWYFKGFCIAGERGLGKQLVDAFDPLPQPASYFSVKEDLLFDLDREIYSDYHHIIVDNIDRLPLDFLREETRGDSEAQVLVEEIASADATARTALYEKLRDVVEGSRRLYNRLHNRVEDAIDLAVKRVRWNFKTALPCFYPQGNAMSLMLPLALVQDDRTDVALVVERTRSGSYQGQTILSLQAAYIDARLICRPDSDWLRTSDIVATDEADEE